MKETVDQKIYKSDLTLIRAKGIGERICSFLPVEENIHKGLNEFIGN